MPDSYGGLPPARLDKPTKRVRPNPMDEQQLVAMLRREEADSSSFYTSELAQAQTDAMDAYNGKIRGDELLPNRSQHVTHDIADTINWIMPMLMRTFAPGDDFLTIDDNALDDNDPTLKDACDYLTYIYFKDNKGEVVTHDFCFDALLQRVGVARAYWQDPEPKPPFIVTEATLEQIIKFQKNPEYQILEAVQDGIEPADDPEAEEAEESFEDEPAADDNGAAPVEAQEAGEQPGTEMVPASTPLQPVDNPTFTIKVQRTPLNGRMVVEAVAPEEFRISRRARAIETADYHAWQRDDFLANLVRLHPDKAGEIDPEGNAQSKPSDVNDTDGDVRVLSRFPDEPSSGQRATYNEDARHKVAVLIEYIKVDYDGDGIVELRRVKRVGNIVLENDIVDESEFVAWSPIRVSHRLIGQSLADTLLDIQKIRTALIRRGMDSLARSTAPRTLINANAIAHDPTILDKLLDHDIGDVIDVHGDPNQVVMTLTTPDVSSTCFQAIEYMDRRSEEASGVNRHAMGIQPDAITDTKGGIEMLTAAGNARVEQVARWLGLGLEELFGKILRTAIRHQDQPRIVKINGRKLEVDPSRWSDEMTVTVHIGMAAESRERKLVMLNDIKNDQATALTQLGPDNPLVRIQHLRNTLARKAQVMGFKNAGEFWGEIPPEWKPAPDTKPDPKTLEIQGKQQLAQTELQSKVQLQQAELQGKQQMAQATSQLTLQIETRKADLAHQLEQMRMESERQIAELKVQADQQAAAVKSQIEAQKAQQEIAADRELNMAKLASERQKQEADLASRTQLADTEAKIQAQIAQVKAEHEREIAQMRVASESQIARERLAAEMELAQWKGVQELKMARWKVGHQVRLQRYKSRSREWSAAARSSPDETGGHEAEGMSMQDETISPGVRFGGQIG